VFSRWKFLSRSSLKESCALDHFYLLNNVLYNHFGMHRLNFDGTELSGTIIRGTLKATKSQLVTPISTKLQRPDGCD
jgi:hypothetical protein